MSESINFLVVEDDDVVAEGIQRAFTSANNTNPIVRASDGTEALKILRGDGGRTPLARPLIILLDLKMPRMGGHKFIEELRADEQLRDNVVFMLSTSHIRKDRRVSYAHNVAGYIVKSRTGEGFQDLAAMLEHYCRVVELPE